MGDSPDLDALVKRIQADLRARRTPPAPDAADDGDQRLRAKLREIRGSAGSRADLGRFLAEVSAPVLVIAALGWMLLS